MMLKRYVALLLAVAMLIVVAGCGSPKPKDSADKAVLAWADMLWSGETENPASVGISKATMDKYHEIVHDYYMKKLELAQFHLDADTQDEVITHLLNEYNEKINLKAEVTKDDSEKPVVKLTFTPMDVDQLSKQSAADPQVAELVQAVGVLNASGVDASTDTAWNQDAGQRLINAFTDPPTGATQSIDVTCEIVKGENGDEVFWAPTDADITKIQNALMK